MSDFDFVDSGGFTWVDLPGSTWQSSGSVDPAIIRLRSPQALNVSTYYDCRLVFGGKIVYRNFEIYLGHANIMDVQLTAQNADTGIVSPLTADQMALITSVSLILGSVEINSDVAGFGINEPFDHITNAEQGIISLYMGEQTIPTGLYRKCHLAVTFSNAAAPFFIPLKRHTIVR